uniref:Uncharacterized protein n=1 Tax=Arundo donax TaxID=35708 RepID=A0A0A9AUT1_ARUDO
MLRCVKAPCCLCDTLESYILLHLFFYVSRISLEHRCYESNYCPSLSTKAMSFIASLNEFLLKPPTLPIKKQIKY